MVLLRVVIWFLPWDYFTQRIMVPCGRCEECLRQQRNDWYVRLERETKYQKSLHRNSVFVTITIAPEYYEPICQACHIGKPHELANGDTCYQQHVNEISIYGKTSSHLMI